MTALFYLVSVFIFYTKDYRYLKIKFLDVGQGDSILITTPKGGRVLVDGGESYDIDEKINKEIPFPFCELDLVIATHTDLDHIGGLNRILQHCVVKEFMFNDIYCESGKCKELSQKIPHKKILKDNNFSLNEIDFKILWPSEECYNGGCSNSNDTSVVMLVDYKNFEMLLTGDASTDILRQIDIASISPLIQGDLDVYKASHHGSDESIDASLIEKLHPKYCVISVGENNKYGHPSQEALDIFNKNNCEIRRTDISGDIEFIAK